MIPSLSSSPGNGPGGMPSMLIMVIQVALILIVFYFLLIRPMRQKQKKLQQLIDSLKAGDRVVTTGGIYGTIVAVAGDVVQLKVASNVKIDIAKSGIAGLAAENRASE